MSDCEREDCRIVQGPTTTTLMNFPPIYNKKGENTNPDLNTVMRLDQCVSCGKVFRYAPPTNPIGDGDE